LSPGLVFQSDHNVFDCSQDCSHIAVISASQAVTNQTMLAASLPNFTRENGGKMRQQMDTGRAHCFNVARARYRRCDADIGHGPSFALEAAPVKERSKIGDRVFPCKRGVRSVSAKRHDGVANGVEGGNPRSLAATFGLLASVTTTLHAGRGGGFALPLHGAHLCMCAQSRLQTPQAAEER